MSVDPATSGDRTVPCSAAQPPSPCSAGDPPRPVGAGAGARLPGGSIDGVIFDLDGTLVDSLGGITAALNEALADEGFGPVTAERVRGIVGDGPRSLCARAAALEAGDGPRIDRLVGRFRARYAAEPVRGTVPYPGVLGVLDALSPRRFAVCTNKGRRVAELVLGAFAILPRLRVLVAEDDLPVRKPDPRPLLVAAERLGVAAARVLVVGDGVQDIGAARGAGMRSCALLQGYTARDVLLAAGPDLVLERIGELPGVFGVSAGPAARGSWGG
ncbi:MAG: HAD-IA family hydrolase [Deltaproteobacteria bacterium]|nr:HAD-IA family hydrolase [Deltaproteobacteria bacterium]